MKRRVKAWLVYYVDPFEGFVVVSARATRPKRVGDGYLETRCIIEYDDGKKPPRKKAERKRA